MRKRIDDWVRSLKSGDGDYKIVFVNDLIKLYEIIGVNNSADDDLLKQLESMGSDRAKIVVIKGVVAKNVQQAMNTIRKKYPNSRHVTSKFTHNYIGSRVPKGDRTMDVAFVDDATKIF